MAQSDYAAKLAEIGGVLHYWKLDEASGTTFAATTGGKNGTWTGGTAGGGTGPDGTAKAPVGANNLYGVIDSTIDLTAGPRVFTWVGFVKVNTYRNEDQVFWGHRDGLSPDRLMEFWPDMVGNYVAAWIGGPTSAFGGKFEVSAQRVPANKWMFVAITYDTVNAGFQTIGNMITRFRVRWPDDFWGWLDFAATVKDYSQVTGNAPNVNMYFGNGKATFLGRADGSKKGSGSVSNVAILNKAITDAEFSALVAAMAAVPTPKSGTDSAAGSDASGGIIAVNAVTSAETASGSDAGAITDVVTNVTGADSGAGSEAATAQPQTIPLSSSEAGVASDAAQATVQPGSLLGDNPAAGPGPWLFGDPNPSTPWDYATGTEGSGQVDVTYVPVAGTDSAAGSDGGSGGPQIIGYGRSASDTATSSDSSQLQTTVLFLLAGASDAGVGSDASVVLTTFRPLAGTDSAAGVDSATVDRDYTITFPGTRAAKARRPRLAGAWRGRQS
jgi:hypothetical protein